MNFDQNTLNALLALDDRTLWQTVRQIAASHNIALPESALPKGDMDRLRSAMSGASAADLNDAMRIINEYGRRGR